MMNNIETLKRALDALGPTAPECCGCAVEWEIAITSIRQAIEQAQQAEPDYYGLTKDHLWMSITKDHYDRLKPEFRMACYTSPPPRQPLTDEEIEDLYFDKFSMGELKAFARAIEAAHGIK